MRIIYLKNSRSVQSKKNRNSIFIITNKNNPEIEFPFNKRTELTNNQFRLLSKLDFRI